MRMPYQESVGLNLPEEIEKSDTNCLCFATIGQNRQAPGLST